MNEEVRLVLDTAERVFAGFTGDFNADGKRFYEAGLTALMVPVDKNGFGARWQDTFPVIVLAGRHAIDDRHVDTVVYAHQATIDDDWSQEQTAEAFAALRAAQMAGAMQAALELTVQYARERQQFGKALATFQAIQQQLALFAEEVAATSMAAAAAFRALDQGRATFACAAAKLRANIAVGTVTSVAHQVHGAMGFTKEYKLQRLTKLLWQWRSAYGNDRTWADVLGNAIAGHGAEGFWPALVQPATIAPSGSG
jgi:alkylation response protein AidB-like acyl-CoA dehydrogenase